MLNIVKLVKILELQLPLVHVHLIISMMVLIQFVNIVHLNVTLVNNLMVNVIPVILAEFKIHQLVNVQKLSLKSLENV